MMSHPLLESTPVPSPDCAGSITHISQSLLGGGGGRPSKLSARNIQHAIHLLSGKAETAVDVTRALQDVVDGSLSVDTTRRHLKKAGMKAVVKKKKPLLTAKHRRERLDFAMAHGDWTVEDWKGVVWSEETKINGIRWEKMGLEEGRGRAQ